MDIANDFDKEIVKITAFDGNRLKLMFKDNSEEDVVWKMPSRKWTDEMKTENYEALRRRSV